MSLEEQKDQVRDFYNQTKATFDESFDWNGKLYPSNRVRMDHCLDLLAKHGCHRVLDAGCGTGTILLEMLRRGHDAMGFDFSEEATEACRAKLVAEGYNETLATQGDIETVDYFGIKFDAIIIMGAFTHPLYHARALANLRRQIRPGGLLLVELRNELFKLWAHDEMVLPLYQKMMPKSNLSNIVLDKLRQQLPPRESVALGDAATQEHEKFFDVPAVWRNPLTVDAEYRSAGFWVFDKLYFHWHAAPPSYAKDYPVLMRDASLELEHYPHDWRGMFQASAFILCARAE